MTNCSPNHPPPRAPATQPVSYSPASLPGDGLAEHDFLYAGETERRRPIQTVSLVRGGKVVWTYTMPSHNAAGHAQEFSDAHLLPDGNFVFAEETRAVEVTPDKKVIWEYDAPPGCEVHVAEPVAPDQVFIMQNGDPAEAMLLNVKTGFIKKETPIPARLPSHTQFRHARLTPDGMILAPQLKDDKVVEYDWNGNVLWSISLPDDPWAAIRLRNGDTLISLEHSGLLEVDAHKKTVWRFTQANCPAIKLFSAQEASRLPNGDTLLCNWVSGNVPLTEWPTTVQLLLITPDKKVIWALRDWGQNGHADLGPATSVQLLDAGDIQR